MSSLIRSSFLVLIAFMAFGCASSQPHIDKGEPKRVLGREGDVRIDAQIFNARLTPNSAVEVRYEIENFRSHPIAVADLLPETTYDIESRTITVKLGSEVPGNEFLPRLLQVNSGEKKAFSAGARVNIRLPAGDSSSPFVPFPRYLRVQLHFLGDVKPFEPLVDIPERAVHDPEMANSLFPAWIENLESVTTNTIPIEWSSTGDFGSGSDATTRSPGRRGRRPGVP
ncbi:MAG TPA: hypothetical protein VIL97_01020 [Thermoanaerobaculia bacterium]